MRAGRSFVKPSVIPGFGLTFGYTLTYLSLIVLIPIAALFIKAANVPLDEIWRIATAPRTIKALQVSFGSSLIAALVNIVFGVVFAGVIIAVAIKIEPMIFSDANYQGLGLIERVREVHPGVKILAFFVFVLGMFRYAQMMIVRATTEIAITNRRLVYKRGLVARIPPLDMLKDIA